VSLMCVVTVLGTKPMNIGWKTEHEFHHHSCGTLLLTWVSQRDRERWEELSQAQGAGRPASVASQNRAAAPKQQQKLCEQRAALGEERER
jgi:hypothetical protein